MTMELSKLSSEMSFCHRGVGVGNGNSNSNSSNGNNVDHCGGTDDDSLILGVEPSASVVSATVPITTRTDSNLLNHLHQHHINNNGGEKNGCYYDSGGGGGTTTNRFDHFDDLELGTSTDDQVPLGEILEKLDSSLSDGSKSPHDQLIRLHAASDGGEERGSGCLNGDEMEAAATTAAGGGGGGGGSMSTSSTATNQSSMTAVSSQHGEESTPISATVNILDLNDPVSLTEHLSQLNDTVLKVSFSEPPSMETSESRSPLTSGSCSSSSTISNCSSSSLNLLTSNFPLTEADQVSSASQSNSADEHNTFYSHSTVPSSGPVSGPGIPNLPSMVVTLPTSPCPNVVPLPNSPLPPKTCSITASTTASAAAPASLAPPSSKPSAHSGTPATTISSSSLTLPLVAAAVAAATGSSPNASTPTRRIGSGSSKSMPQTCSTCSKTFSNASALTKHRLTHSEERRYHCPTCSKAFKRQDHLNGHKLTHRSTKPFACLVDGCGKSYCDARSLRRHKENHHSGGPGGTKGVPVEEKEKQPQSGTTTTIMQIQESSKSKILSTKNNFLSPEQLKVIEQLISNKDKATSSTSSSTTPATMSPLSVTASSNPTSLSVAGPLPFVAACNTSPAIKGTGKNSNDARNSSGGGTNVVASINNCALNALSLKHEEEICNNSPSIMAPMVSAESKKQTLKLNNPPLTSTATLLASCSERHFSTGTATPSISSAPTHPPPTPLPSQEPLKLPEKSVECTMCSRKFKNIPALNGHMRLHGGYFKKDPSGEAVTTTTGCTTPTSSLTIISPTVSAKALASSSSSSVSSAPTPSPPLPPPSLPNPTLTLASLASTDASGALRPLIEEAKKRKATSSNENGGGGGECVGILQHSNSNKLSPEQVKLLSASPPPPNMSAAGSSSSSSSSDLCPTPAKRAATTLSPQSLVPPVNNLELAGVGHHGGGRGDIPFRPLPPPNTTQLLANLERKTQAAAAVAALHQQQQSKQTQVKLTISTGSSLPACPSDISGSSPSLPTRPLSQHLPMTLNLSDFTSGLHLLRSPSANLASQIDGSNNNNNNKSLISNCPSIIPRKTGSLTISSLNGSVSSLSPSNPQSLPSLPIAGASLVAPAAAAITAVSSSSLSSSSSSSSIPASTTTATASKLNPPQLQISVNQHHQTQNCSNNHRNINNNYNYNNNNNNNNHHSAYHMRVDRDLEKKPRIGEEFQAEIPQLVSQDGLKPDITSVEKSQLVWKPTTGAKVTQRGLESYLALASSCIVPGGSRNEELALEVLHKHSGHVHTALKELLVKQDLEPCWTEQEVNGFYECLVKHQKDFGKISQELRSKSIKEAVAYYYLWKNICREESQSFKHIFSSATAQQRLEQQHHHHQQQYQQQQNDPGEHPTPFVTATIAMTSSHLTNMLMTSPSVSISSVANNNNTMSEGSHITLTT